MSKRKNAASYKLGFGIFVICASVLFALSLWFVSVKIQINKSNKEIEELKSKIRVEKENLKLNIAVQQTLASRERITELAALKLKLVENNDFQLEFQVSKSEINELERRLQE